MLYRCFITLYFLIVFLIHSIESFSIINKLPRDLRIISKLNAIDLSQFPIDSSEIQSFSIQNSDGDKLEVIQNALIIVAAIGYFIYEKRPYGGVNNDLVEIRKSLIPGGNLGLYAKNIIPAGVVIGTFPGFLKNVEVALNSKKDEKARKMAKRYM